MASFGQLSLIIVAGLCGPLLASSRRLAIPVVVGELLGGVALGKTGAGLIKPDDPSIAFLGNIGFAVLMLVAGMHVPIRNRALLGSLRGAVLAVLVTAALGVAGGGWRSARGSISVIPRSGRSCCRQVRRRSCSLPSKRRA